MNELNRNFEIIWIEYEENTYQDYANTLTDLKANKIKQINDSSIEIEEFQDINQAIEKIKTIKFKETIIIVDENYFLDFVKKFNDNIRDIYIIPQIIIHSEQNKINFKLPDNIENKSFYCHCKDTFDNIIKYLESLKNKENNIENNSDNNSYPQASAPTNLELIFQRIRHRGDLKLPEFYEILLDILDIKDDQFINEIKNYKNDKKYKSLFHPIISIPDIPIELLSKYYARMYTVDGNFFEKMKRDLLKDNNKQNIIYQSYIKTMYEGVEKKSLKTLSTFNGVQLYSAQYFTEEQIKEINDYKINKVEYFDEPIVYSKLFLSFTKDINVALNFLENYHKNILITIIGANTGYKLDTHIDVENLSYFPNEKEVLFFPFSAFGIEVFSLDQNKSTETKKIYNMKLMYYGRFIKKYEPTKKFNIEKDPLPDFYFKALFKKSGLIDQKKIDIMIDHKSQIQNIDLPYTNSYPPDQDEDSTKCTCYNKTKIILIMN